MDTAVSSISENSYYLIAYDAAGNVPEVSNTVSFIAAKDTSAPKVSAEQNKQLKALNKGFAKADKRLKELDTLIANLYEDKVSGVITGDMFNRLSRKFTDEQTELKQAAKQQNQQLRELGGHKVNADKFIDTVRKYTEITELTPEILGEFIEKVLIYDKDKVTHTHSRLISTLGA